MDICISLSSHGDGDVVQWLRCLNTNNVDHASLYHKLFINGCNAARALQGTIVVPSQDSQSSHESQSSESSHESSVSLEFQKTINELRSTLAREREQFDSTVSLKVRLALAEDSASLRAAAETHRKAHLDLVDALKALAEGESLRENDALRKRLLSLETELSTIRRTNHGLGVEGEERVAMTLRRIFPHAEIISKHSDAHSCDYWIKDDDMIIPVEVKNKRDITKADVDRFHSDVAGLMRSNGDIVAGAIFLSCRTPNIPGHGTLRLVYQEKKDLPIIFIGMDESSDNGDMFGALKSPLELFMNVARRTRFLSNREDPRIELQKILDSRLMPMIERAKKVRQTLKDASIASAAALAAADRELEALFSLASIDLLNHPNEGATTIIKCAQCGRVCRSQQGLRAHARVCKGEKN